MKEPQYALIKSRSLCVLPPLIKEVVFLRLRDAQETYPHLERCGFRDVS